MHTDRDALERVATFDRQLREQAERVEAERLAAELVVTCDSCGEPIDRAVEPGRYRHEACPTPPLPATAEQVLARLRARRDEGGDRGNAAR